GVKVTARERVPRQLGLRDDVPETVPFSATRGVQVALAALVAISNREVRLREELRRQEARGTGDHDEERASGHFLTPLSFRCHLKLLPSEEVTMIRPGNTWMPLRSSL